MIADVIWQKIQVEFSIVLCRVRQNAWSVAKIGAKQLKSLARCFRGAKQRASLTHVLVDEQTLSTGYTLINQDLNLNATVFRPPGLSLVGCRSSVFAHRTRRYDMPHWHTTLLD